MEHAIEMERIQVLDSLRIMDTLPEAAYDCITELAANICDVPMAMVSLVGKDRQFFKSKIGIQNTGMPIEESICNYAIKSADPVFIIEDTRKDPRFNSFPSVLNDPHLVYYASVSLKIKDGPAIGTLCVLDNKPKLLTAEQIKALQNLALQVEQLLMLRKSLYELDDTHRQLEIQSQKIQAVIEATKVGVWDWDISKDKILVDDRWAAMLGYSVEELQDLRKESYFNLIHQEDQANVFGGISNFFAGVEVYFSFRCKMVHKEGHLMWIENNGKITARNKEGTPLHAMGIHQDITEKVIREIHFKTLSNNIPGAVFRYRRYPDKSDKLELIQGRAFDLWGVQPTDILQNLNMIKERYDRVELGVSEKKIKESEKILKTCHYEWKYNHPDGTTRWHKGSGNPTQQPDGSVIWDCIITDFTEDIESKQRLVAAEEKSRKNEKLMLEAQHLAKIGSWNLHMKNNLMQWSEALCTVLEVPFHQDNNYFENFFELVVPEDKIRVQNFLKKAIESNKTFCLEFGIITRAGKRKYIELTGHRPKDTKVNEDFLSGTAQDISQSKKYQNAIAESNQRFKYVAKATSDVIWDWNIETNEVYIGDNFQEYFGQIDHGDLSIIAAIVNRLHPNEKAEIIKKIEKQLSGHDTNWTQDHQFLKEDGNYAFVSNKAVIIRDEHRKACRVIGAIQDITKRKEEEHQLKLLESVVTNTEDSIIITEAESIDEPGPKILYVNDAFTRMTGYTLDEVKGKTPRILQGPESNYEGLRQFGEALRKWEPFELTTINYRKNGEKYWVNFLVKPVANEHGWFTHWFSIQRDVTVQINMERQKKLLSEISQLLNRGLPIKETLDKVLLQLHEFTELKLAEVWLVSTNKKTVYLNVSYPNDRETMLFYDEFAPKREFLIGEGIPGNISKEKKVHIWEDLNALEFVSRKEAFFKIGIYKIIGVPMFNNNVYIGCLTLGFSNKVSFPAFYPDLFRDLGHMLGNEIMRKKAETELDQLFINSPDIIGITDRCGYFIKVNPAFCKMLGYSDEELTSISFFTLLHPDDIVKSIKEYNKEASGSILSKDFVNRYRTKQGEYKWISWNSSQLEEDTGYVFAYGRDISETVELKNLLDTANQMARIGGWEINLETNRVYLSEISCSIYEYEKYTNLQLQNFIESFSGSAQKEFKSHLDMAIQKGNSLDFELPVITSSQKEIWVRIMGKVEWRAGKVYKIFGSIQDIHTRKTAELSFEKEYQEKNEILESIGDVFITVDGSGLVTYWNQQAENVLSIPAEEILGQPLERQLAESGIIELSSQLFSEQNQELSQEIYLQQLKKWFEITSYPLANGRSFYLKDITFRKTAEEKVRHYNERFVLVSKATNEAIWEWEMSNDKLYQGDGFKTLFGYEPGLSQGISQAIWHQRLHPEDRDRMNTYFETVIKGSDIHKFSNEYRYIKADGNIAFVIDRGVIVRDSYGKLFKLIGAIQDISERKKYEESLKVLNKELENHARELAISNEELEKFAFVASHDLQEPLRMVSSFLSQLDKKYGHLHDEKAKQYIHFAVDGAKRMRQIILDLLEYSRVGKNLELMEHIPLNDLLEEVKSMLHKLIGEKMAVIEYNALPSVACYRSSLFRVFQNLISNALKYSTPNVAAKIIIDSTEQSDSWIISVQDNGIGIEETYFEKIFIIFQKLHPKEVFEGTGIGLTIVKKTVESFGGQIWVKSIQGEGSTFYFSIPKKR